MNRFVDAISGPEILFDRATGCRSGGLLFRGENYLVVSEKAAKSPGGRQGISAAVPSWRTGPGFGLSGMQPASSWTEITAIGQKNSACLQSEAKELCRTTLMPWTSGHFAIEVVQGEAAEQT